MKKLKHLLLLTVFLLAFLAAGCSAKNDSTSTNNTVTPDVTQAAEVSEVPEATETPAAEPVKEAESVELLIAAAASLQNAMEEIKPL